jgi:aromatic-L-amino-acid decarboxylase
LGAAPPSERNAEEQKAELKRLKREGRKMKKKLAAIKKRVAAATARAEAARKKLREVSLIVVTPVQLLNFLPRRGERCARRSVSRTRRFATRGKRPLLLARCCCRSGRQSTRRLRSGSSDGPRRRRTTAARPSRRPSWRRNSFVRLAVASPVTNNETDKKTMESRGAAGSLEVTPEAFRGLTGEVVDILAAFLEDLDELPVFPPSDGATVEQLFGASDVPEKGLGKEALKELRTFVQHARAQNGRFLGYVMGNGEAVAALGDLFASVLNQNMTAWRASPSGVTVERAVTRWLAQAIGCEGFTGTLTSGGSLGTMMALAMAREAKLAANETGLWGHAKVGTVYASQEVHMSVSKAVALLGIGRNQLRLIACDDAFRMIPAELERAIARDEKEGCVPIAIVASAGSVSTGSIDPLREVAAIAAAHNVWLHVDGAYGALAAIAAPEKLVGINLADSISLDPHKWLYQPLDVSCLLHRHPEVARQTFCDSGAYTAPLSKDAIEGYAFFEESFELSRRCRGLKLWLSLRFHGLETFRLCIQRDLDHAQLLARAVDACPLLVRLAPVELSAVCFQHILRPDASVSERNAFNLKLLKCLKRRGKVYLSNADLRGAFCLRACFVNHLTVAADIEIIVQEVLDCAKQVSE